MLVKHVISWAYTKPTKREFPGEGPVKPYVYSCILKDEGRWKPIHTRWFGLFQSFSSNMKMCLIEKWSLALGSPDFSPSYLSVLVSINIGSILILSQ